MNLQAALVLIPAGIALYSGIYHLFLHTKSRKNSTEGHLPFALVCITIAFYDIFAAFLYASGAPAASGQWQRYQLVSLAALGIFMIWFFSNFVKRSSKILDAIFICAFLAHGILLLLNNSELTLTSKPVVRTVMLFGRQLAVYHEMKPGILVAVQGLVGFLAIVYILTSLVRYLSKHPASSSAAMLSGFVVVGLAMVNDTLVSNGIYSFFYLIEYSFVILAISMAYALACRQMHLENTIVASEEKLRDTINSVPDIIYSLDSRMLISGINEAASKLLGYPLEQMTGRNLLEFVHPEDRDTVRDKAELAAANKAQIPENLRFRLCNCDGEPIWVSLNSRMIYGDDGRLLREQGVIRDIRTVKEYEEELQQLAAAVNQADESIIITDRRGVMQYVNPFFEKMTGYSKEEVIGKNTSILKSGKHNETFYSDLWSTLRSGQTWRGRFTNRKKDGTLFDENAVISPVMSSEGKILHYVAVKRDITQEVALESQLRESQKMEAIGRLAGGIAHDFTNALVIILNSAQIAKKRIPAEKGDVHELLDQVIAASEKTSSLTSQLLAFSHSHQISPRVMNLNKVIAGVDTMIQRMMGSRVSLNINPAPYSIFVKIDPSQIEQILIHLCVNANDAMPEGGRLSISTSAIRLSKDESIQIGASVESHYPVFGDMGVISITDSGCGMPQDILAHIFEPFFTTKGRTKSTGLGLSTVYAIAQKHGGCVDVYSAPGFGTTFRIFLPLANGTNLNSKETHLLRKGGERIMVIEDNMVFRRTLVQQLKTLGYSVFEVDDALSAINTFRQTSGSINLVITDLIMPHLNGKLIAKELAAIKPGAKIIFASAYPRDHLLEAKLLDAGDPFIPKPFSLKEVAEITGSVLDS